MDHWLTCGMIIGSLLRNFKFASQKQPINYQLHLVADIINPSTGSWDLNQLSASIVPFEKNEILKIPLSLHPTPNSWILHYDNRGIFIVKSTYYLIVSQSNCYSKSSSSHHYPPWNKLWNLDHLLKIKLFISKAFQENLPTTKNIFKRKVVFSTLCLRCHLELKYVMHCPITCPNVMNI